jgi:hypothetical protein
LVAFYAGSAGVGICRTVDSGRAVGLPMVGLDRSRYEPKEIVMNPIRPIRRVAGVLAGLACAWLGLTLAAPAAFAGGSPTPGPAGYIVPQPDVVGGSNQAPVPVHTVVIGGTPGWQITLIAFGAALLAATAAVLVYRAWAARRRPVTAAA